MTSIASECRSANIVRNHAMILPDDATPKPDGIFGKDRVFERGHLGETTPVPRVSTEASVEERANQLAGEVDADDATAEHQHVHVVVLNALVRRKAQRIRREKML